VAPGDTLGIGLSQAPVPGMISWYEEHDARTGAGYTLTEWYNLDPRDRALEVGMYRIKGAIEYQKNKKQEQDMKKARKK
jgi:hypothetical protein